jgi:hypothetical protein
MKSTSKTLKRINEIKTLEELGGFLSSFDVANVTRSSPIVENAQTLKALSVKTKKLISGGTQTISPSWHNTLSRLKFLAPVRSSRNKPQSSRAKLRHRH